MPIIEHELVKQSAETAPCQEDGCSESGFPCYLPDPDYEPYYYCGQHAGSNGFCQVCGQFEGGVESFEFLHPGLCDDCDFQLKDSLGELDEDDDGYDPASDY